MYPNLLGGLNTPLNSIIDRYLIRELAFTWLATLVVMLLIYSGQQSVVLLEGVSRGQLDGTSVVELIGLTMLGYMPNLLPFTLYVGILLTIGRLYRDSEMSALAACGVGEPRLARTIGLFAAGVALVSLAWSLWGAPVSQSVYERTLAEAHEKSGISSLTPGRFNEFQLDRGQAVFYAETVDGGSGRLSGVFVRLPPDETGGEDVVVAERGRQFTDPASGRRYLQLESGRRYEGRPGSGEYTITRFERNRVHLPEAEPAEARKLRSRPTAELLGSGDPELQAELHWRLALPLSTLPLALLAVPLARSSPRQGRYSRLFVALLIFIIYGNLMGIARSWVESGVVPGAVGLWWVHLLVLGLAGSMLYSGLRLPEPRRARTTDIASPSA